MRVEDLLRGVIIQSGNDASIALAQGIAGSEPVARKTARLASISSSPIVTRRSPDTIAVVFRDDGEDYRHYTRGNWAGIVGVMRADVQALAR